MLAHTDTPIIGERVYLRHLEATDATERYCTWLNDPEVNQYLETRQSTIPELEQYIRDRRLREDCLFLGIFWKGTDEHIGNVKLEPIDRKVGTATIGILIGEKAFWGKGVATEVINLVVDFVFETLKLHEVKLGVIAEHVVARHAYEKCGFRIDRIDEKAINHRGVLFDQVWMSRQRK